MLKRLDPGTVVSDEGYQIGFDREMIKYNEGNHRMYVDSPSGYRNGKYYIYIEVQSIDHWLPPYQNEVVSAAEKEKILSRIKEMVTFLGYNYKILYSPNDTGD